MCQALPGLGNLSDLGVRGKKSLAPWSWNVGSNNNHVNKTTEGNPMAMTREDTIHGGRAESTLIVALEGSGTRDKTFKPWEIGRVYRHPSKDQ